MRNDPFEVTTSWIFFHHIRAIAYAIRYLDLNDRNGDERATEKKPNQMEKISQSETMNRERLNGQQEQAMISDKTVKLDISIDLNDDLNDGALQVIKSVKPLWTINEIRFKVSELHLS